MYFSDKREKEIILVGFIAAFTCIIFGILPVNTHLVIMGIVAVIFGFTAIGFNVLFLTLIGEIAGPEKAGQAIGFWVTIAYIGAVITPPLFGMVVDGIGFPMAWVSLGSLLMATMVFTLVYTRKNPF
jgi:predicted MFS family arabinose efflux permease